MKQLIYIWVLAFASLGGIAQNKTTIINGKITSFEESLPLEGAGIAVKDGKNITGSQVDGTFTLEVTEEDKALLITLQGYQEQEIKLTGAREYNIILKRSGTLKQYAGFATIFNYQQSYFPLTHNL